MYQFGRFFRVTLSGESHGSAIVVSLDGVPSGLRLDGELFAGALLARRPLGVGETARRERDEVELLTGVCDGYTTGNPVTLAVRNGVARSVDYEAFFDHPRPGHADYSTVAKWGRHGDIRGGGIASGRMTVGLVLAGVVARLLVPDVRVEAEVVEIGGASQGWDEQVALAQEAGDSVGGIVACRADGVEVGVGSPFFDSVESLLAHLLFSIPGVKGVEFGAGFGMAGMRGSECNDCFIGPNGELGSNHNGGVAGGISTGAPLYFRVAFRPPSSIAMAQMTYHGAWGGMRELRVGGRHDACYVRRAVVVVESVVRLVLADLYAQRGSERRMRGGGIGEFC